MIDYSQPNVVGADNQGNPLYATRNGPKSEAQVHNELVVAAQYGGPTDIVSKLRAYDQLMQRLQSAALITGQPGTPPFVSQTPLPVPTSPRSLATPVNTPVAASSLPTISPPLLIGGALVLFFMMRKRR